MPNIEFGPGQIKIMRVLWDKKSATAQEIADALNEIEQTKLINVQMIFKRLVEKGAVSYDVDNRTYIYYPLVCNNNVIQHAVHSFMDHIFAGSVDDMVSYLIKNERVSSEVLQKIKKMIYEKEE